MLTIHEKRLAIVASICAIVIVGTVLGANSATAPDLAPRYDAKSQDTLSKFERSKGTAGDVNNDGRFDIADPRDLAAHLSGIGKATNYENGDFNTDRAIDGRDVRDMLIALERVYLSNTLEPGLEQEIVYLQGTGIQPMPWECNGPFIRGDANDDGTVNLADVVTMLDNLFVINPPYQPTPRNCRDQVDANDNEGYNIADPITVAISLFPITGQPPVSIPEPNVLGHDEDAYGALACNGVDEDGDCPGDTNGDGVVCSYGDIGVDEGECKVRYDAHIGESIGTIGPTLLTELDFEAILTSGTFAGSTTTQTVELANAPLLSFIHFKDNDFFDEGPALGLAIDNFDELFTHRITFNPPAVATIASGLDEFAGETLTTLGRDLFVVYAAYTPNNLVMELVDQDIQDTLSFGSIGNYNHNGQAFQVQISFISPTQAQFVVNGEVTGPLNEQNSWTLTNDYTIVVDEIIGNDVTFVLGRNEYYMQSNGADLEINSIDVDQFTDYKWTSSFTYTATPTTIELSEIALLNRADDEVVFGFPTCTPTTPGCGTPTSGSATDYPLIDALEFTITNGLVPGDYEELSIVPDGDDSFTLTAPVTDGVASLNLLYKDSSDTFAGTGLNPGSLLASSMINTLFVDEDIHDWFVVSYNNPAIEVPESYVMKIDNIDDSDPFNPTVTLRSTAVGSNVQVSLQVGETEDIGGAAITLNFADDNTGEIQLQAANPYTRFDRLYTKEGLRVDLPVQCSTAAPPIPECNFSPGTTSTYVLNLNYEAGIADTAITLGINSFETSVVGVGPQPDYETYDNTGIYEGFSQSENPIRTFYHTGFDQDFVEILYYYHDTYGQITLNGRAWI